MYSLSGRARQDLANIVSGLLGDEKRGGLEAALLVDGYLDQCMLRIADRAELGHRRYDVKLRRSLLFAVAAPTKYVVAFDPETREIVRILHGAMDFTRRLEAEE